MPLVPHQTVARPRLVTRIGEARVAFVVAGSGYGKSTLAEQAAADAGIATVALDLGGVRAGVAPVLGALRRAVRTAGMGALDAALAVVAEQRRSSDLASAAIEAFRSELGVRDDPILLLVDEVQDVAAEGISLVAGLVAAIAAPHRAIAAPHRAIVAGRVLPDAVAAAAPDAIRIGVDDLAFDADEVAALAGSLGRPLDSVTAASMCGATDGWPAAVALAVSLAGGVDRARGPLPSGVEAQLDRLLAAAGAGATAAAVAIAHLPRIDERVADLAAGPGALARLVGAGLPIRGRLDGWLELPDPVRDVLRRRGALDPSRARAVAEALFDATEPGLALDVLVEAHHPDTLAATLAGRSWHELTPLEAGEVMAALAGLPASTLERHPRVLLAAARVAESSAHLAWRTQLLEQAQGMSAVAADPVLRREVLAELAADASRSGEDETARARAQEVIRGAGPEEARSRAVALTALGRTDAFSRDASAMTRAADHLVEAAALLRPLGEPDLLRTTLQVLGYGIHFARGDLDAAVVVLREAADLDAGAIRTRAGIQTFLADALVAAGRLGDAEAVLREVLGVARRLRDQRLLAYHAWMRASIESRRGEASAVEAWLAEAERHPGDWFGHPTGIEFLADATDHLARVGLDVEAHRYLRRVEARCAADGRPGIDQIALVARAMVGARAGDPVQAERDLVACLEIEQVAPREHWRIHLLRALAALRGGDPESARRHARRATGMAAAMGHPGLPRILEAAAVARLEGASGSIDVPEPAGDGAVAEATARISVRVLGRFSVALDGSPADLPDGRPAQLVKLLAVAGRRVPVDEAVETLWPDVDPDLGRQRLRNVLARIRAACGGLVVREEETLGLDATAEVDLARFEAAARAALAAPASSQEPLLRSALSRHAGELLPGDRYEDFAAAARERVAVRHVALLDRLAMATAARGDVDESLGLLEDAIAAEPLDDRRYRMAIDIAIRHGRRDRAIRLLERAVAMDAELAGEPSEDLVAIARTLGVRPATR